MEELNSLSVSELRQMAKEKGIIGYSSMKKSELVAALAPVKAPVKPAETAKPAEAAHPVKEEKPAEAVRPVREEKPAEAVRPARAERPAEPVRPVRTERPVPTARQERPVQQPQTARTERPMQPSQTTYAERPSQPGQVIRRTVGDPSMIQRQSAPAGENAQLDSGISKCGILEIAAEQSFGFIRNENYLPGPDDVYVSPALIKRYNLTTGDIICGNLKVKSPAEKFVALLYITKINGENPELSARRKRFDKLTPVFPHDRLRLETPGGPTSVRIVDLLSPIGKGQRGMIVSPPKAGKTTLLKDIARAVQKNNPDLHMIILLIDERPEEVTDMKDSIKGDNVEIIYSTFDEAPEQHKRVSEMTVEHAKRLVEYGKDVIILLDSITRLARAYNLTCQSSGRTLSGGLDPAALYMPKRFFGAARCMKEGGSLTILATALVDTGSRMDDVVFEEFKGTGNMELTLNRALSERRIFPAIDLPKSSTRREDLLLSPVEQEANLIMRRAFGGARAEEATEQIVNMFTHTRSNAEFITQLKRTRIF
ncbi:MAG: transcription termination factor Rho [Lachnospiraceae bacterium]|nr:transcription termination factor Rho [Lachnospiraceae bacterium]